VPKDEFAEAYTNFIKKRFYQIKILLANMYNNSFFKKILVVACVVFLYDKDYNSIGDGLIGDNHFDFVKYTSSVVAYNQKIGPIESNLPVNALGILTILLLQQHGKFCNTIGFRICQIQGKNPVIKVSFNDSLFQYFKIY
jgi:hypothetical protein